MRSALASGEAQRIPPAIGATGGPAAAEAERPPRRTQFAVMALYLLAPFTGEVLSGSTPLLGFSDPFVLIWETALYGSAALLIREIARRRGLGWTSIVLLGAAYGVFEEGLVINIWFNPFDDGRYFSRSSFARRWLSRRPAMRWVPDRPQVARRRPLPPK